MSLKVSILIMTSLVVGIANAKEVRKPSSETEIRIANFQAMLPPNGQIGSCTIKTHEFSVGENTPYSVVEIVNEQSHVRWGVMHQSSVVGYINDLAWQTFGYDKPTKWIGIWDRQDLRVKAALDDESGKIVGLVVYRGDAKSFKSVRSIICGKVGQL